ncbi:MAG: discoidin domain-containing protein, partial [Pirellulaceae bacterium]
MRSRARQTRVPRWAVLVVAGVLFGVGPLGLTTEKSDRPSDSARPSIEDYATIEAYVGDVPVYAFGFSYVYGVGPELLPGVVMQEGNTKAVAKLKPKKSWEITSNLCGSTPAREPKTMWNDDQPLLPIHLIDGDPETAWSSRGMTAPGVQPEWIRVDLPAESTVAAVALVCSKVGPSANAKLRLGKSLP